MSFFLKIIVVILYWCSNSRLNMFILNELHTEKNCITSIRYDSYYMAGTDTLPDNFLCAGPSGEGFPEAGVHAGDV